MKRMKNWADVEAKESEIYRARIELDIAREEKENKEKMISTTIKNENRRWSGRMESRTIDDQIPDKRQEIEKYRHDEDNRREMR